MKNILFIAFCIFYFTSPAFSSESDSGRLHFDEITNTQPHRINNTQNSSNSLWEFIKGHPTKNQLHLGMFTFHFTPSSLEERQWNNKLLGIQYNDFSVFAFENSFYNWCAGVAYNRDLYQSALNNDWDMNLGYRAGLMYGYEDGEAPFSSSSPIIPLVALYSQFVYNEHYGVELMLTTSLSLGFFYRF